MHREHVQWYSSRLDRDMELLTYGHAGTPILAFPSSMGRFYEWEDFGMVDALHAQLDSGQNVLVCVDSVDHESLYNEGVDPYVRIKRHQQYEQYVIVEVIPFAYDRGTNDFLIVSGASFGAFHAANVTFKRPWDVGKLIAMSGSYDIRSFFDGFYNEDVYFSNPVDYLPGLDDHDTLEALRDTHLILTMGEHDPCREPTEHLSSILSSKSVGHHVDQVPGSFGHDWPWWKEQIQRHL
jgi:esterase/lipase superfamily enzyme